MMLSSPIPEVLVGASSVMVRPLMTISTIWGAPVMSLEGCALLYRDTGPIEIGAALRVRRPRRRRKQHSRGKGSKQVALPHRN